MLGLLLAKLIFSGYRRKIVDLVWEKNLSEFQKAISWARYYLFRQKIVVKWILRRSKGQNRIDLEEYLNKLYNKAHADLNLFINEISTCPLHSKAEQIEFNFDQFIGLKLDRQIVRKLFKWSLTALRYLIVSPQLFLNVVIRSLELLKRGVKKLSPN